MEQATSNVRYLSEAAREACDEPRPAREASPRPYTAHGRAMRDGQVLCQAALVVVQGPPGTLGATPRDDLTAWFYGALDPRFELELEQLADARRGFEGIPEVEFDLVLEGPGGPLELNGCRVGLPVRSAGPASTLEYRLAHPGAVGASSGGRRHLRLVA